MITEIDDYNDSITIDYVTQVTHLLVFDCKIGDFKIAGCVCLQRWQLQ